MNLSLKRITVAKSFFSGHQHDWCCGVGGLLRFMG